MIYYHLSSRQFATIETGEPLRIALPITYHFPQDGTPAERRRWFLDSLHDCKALSVRDLQSVRLWAHLTNRGGSLTGDPDAMTLATRLGELVDDRNRDRLPCYPVECVVAVVGGDNQERPAKPPRWPGGKMVYVKHESS